jgi:hypothetical protein
MDGSGNVEWLTKAEAVAHAGISLRTIEREISLKNIRTKQRRQVGRRSVTILHPEDVARLRQEFISLSPTDPAKSLVDGQEEALQLPAMRSQGDMVSTLLHSLRPVVEGKPAFLPVKEAAAYIGLPEGYLRKCIKEGTLKPVVHGSYYIRLADLHRL